MRWNSIAAWSRRAGCLAAALLAAVSLPLQAEEPLLSSRFMDIAYPSRDAFVKDLLRQRRPAALDAPGARYRAPVVSPVLWQNKEAVVLTQQALLSGQPYHLVVFIVGADNKPLYRGRRYHIECRLAGRYTRQQAIDSCRTQQQGN
ncbi:hypothetical protein [Gallaecimonas pentaromativorans]|uniref:hypothetical protein n=1 Tax=Gallaecimonas pentaromativorans TaxID=584787 RepID=UPI003A9418E6